MVLMFAANLFLHLRPIIEVNIGTNNHFKL